MHGTDVQVLPVMLYVYGAVPPVVMAFTTPVQGLRQLAFVEVSVESGLPTTVIVITLLVLQLAEAPKPETV